MMRFNRLLALLLAVFAVAAAPAAQKKPTPGQATAIFAMGCFWCAEADFEKVPGVVKVVSGYTGGTIKNPTYEEVSADTTGHYEAVLVTYDPAKIKYSDLLTVFWKNVDPFDTVGQFCDKGSSYRAAIFPGNEAERKAAQASRDYLVGFFKRDLATRIMARSAFYPAEDYHQDYYKNNPIRYRYYRSRCGRDDRLKEVWGE
jgi:peptide-methionine (S)-S-oxide reductase